MALLPFNHPSCTLPSPPPQSSSSSSPSCLIRYNLPSSSPVFTSSALLRPLRWCSNHHQHNHQLRYLTPVKVTGSLSSAVETSGSGNSSQVEEGEKKLLLQVKDLTAVIAESKQEILKGVNLTVYQGEVHAIMGKNGSGKSTFAKVLAGHPEYEITGGSVVFKGENLLEMAAEDRSLSGLFMSFQSPVEIPGVTNIDFLNMAYNARRKKLGLPELGPIEFYAYIFPKLDLVNMKTDFLNRNVNEGFSGGEKKRNEILQLAGNMVSKVKPMTNEDQKFQSKALSLSHTKTAISTIKEKLSLQQLQRFQDSCFDHILLIEDLKWIAQIVPKLLLRKADPKTVSQVNGIKFIIGSKMIQFTA